MSGVVALIDAGGANLGSVSYALERLGAQVRIARDADALRGAARVILPGVGAAGPAMRLLAQRGFVPALNAIDVPLFGICLGMQLLFEASDESGDACLGLLPGRVRALRGAPGVRVPHMGWNRVDARGADPLLDEAVPGAQAYFVHGFAAPVTEDCIATATHGDTFAAMVRRGHVCGAQFHPERSATFGAQVLRNFLSLRAGSAIAKEVA